MVWTQFVFRDRPVEVVWKELLLVPAEAYSDRLLVTDISTTWAEVIFWVKWIVFTREVFISRLMLQVWPVESDGSLNC